MWFASVANDTSRISRRITWLIKFFSSPKAGDLKLILFDENETHQSRVSLENKNPNWKYLCYTLIFKQCNMYIFLNISEKSVFLTFKCSEM